VKTVFLDIDTQMDFLYPAGALYVPGAEKLAGVLGELTQHAAANRIPLVSTTDAHSEDDPEFKIWPPHCVAGTAGQQKSGVTLLPRRYVLTGAPDALDRDAALTAQQIVVEKHHVDPFNNPNLTRLLDLLEAERYVVYGVVTEVCVANAVRGLLEIGSGSTDGMLMGLRLTKAREDSLPAAPNRDRQGVYMALRAAEPDEDALSDERGINNLGRVFNGADAFNGAKHARQARIEIIEDAVNEFSEPAGRDALAGLVSAGAVLTSARAILEKL
jgi:nicotinamidase/pyrazinamidase